MALGTFNRNNSNQERLIVNYQIRAPKVLCIDQNNVNLGVVTLSHALSLASASGLDLVQVSPPSKDGMPTCKLLDSGKYKYELSKKRKEADKKQREAVVKTKEIKFRPTTDLNDLKTKAKKVEEFVEEGCRVKVTIVLRGREFSHQDVAAQTLTSFMDMLPGMQMLGRPALDLMQSGSTRRLSVFLVKKDV